MKSCFRSVFPGFLLLYLASMLVATWLLKSKFDDEYDAVLKTKAGVIQSRIYQESLKWQWQGDSITKNQKRFLDICLVQITNMYEEEYQMISGAIYDTEGKLAAKSRNLMGSVAFPDSEGETEYQYYVLDDYLTEEELWQAAKHAAVMFQEENIQTGLPEYLIRWKRTIDRQKLVEIQINKVRWKKQESDEEIDDDLPDQYRGFVISTEDGGYRISKCETKWEWKDRKILENTKIQKESMQFADVLFPEIRRGFSYWERWQSDSYLHNYPEKLEGDNWENFLGEDDSNKEYRCAVYFGEDAGMDHIYTLSMRMTTYPWRAAVNDMKYVYLGGFLLMLGCSLGVAFSMDRVYRQRTALEEMRRDFTNAIAHELKTPLSVIRSFAENLKENTIEEKRGYYLDQIVGQTETMDELVQKMCEVSRLESSQIILKKESVNISELIKGQIEKFQYQIQEKNLEIIYLEQAPLEWNGDRYYLEKAFSNLISNAVEYNCRDGWIRITIGKEKCTIENTGNRIPQENLSHVKEMFFTGNESRTEGEKHLGLGLYLADRILGLHQLKLSVENTESGVLATVTEDA